MTAFEELLERFKTEQKTWFLNELSTSDAKWKIVGQQVIFAELNVGWAGAAVGSSYEALESLFLDIWDGYPAERQKILQLIEQSGIDHLLRRRADHDDGMRAERQHRQQRDDPGQRQSLAKSH